MKIDLLAISYPDWKTFINHCQETLGFCPTAGIGQTYIKSDSPAAYLASLDLENHQMESLRKGTIIGTAFYHFFVSFCCTLDTDTTLEFITKFSFLEIFTKKGKDSYFLIVSGNMVSWHKAVHSGLQESQSHKMRVIFHEIYSLFLNIGMKEIWTNNQKKSGKDGLLVFL
jgi:hypothetical protein